MLATADATTLIGVTPISTAPATLETVVLPAAAADRGALVVRARWHGVGASVGVVARLASGSVCARGEVVVQGVAQSGAPNEVRDEVVDWMGTVAWGCGRSPVSLILELRSSTLFAFGFVSTPTR